MNDYEDYIDRIRASADARKPLTTYEKKFMGVYALIVLIVVLIAAVTNH
jgi:hypothetical protein